MNPTKKGLLFAAIGALMLIGLITSQINLEELTAPGEITFRDGAARVFVMICSSPNQSHPMEYIDPIEKDVIDWLVSHDYTVDAFERFDFELDLPCKKGHLGMGTGETLSGWAIFRKTS